jgi:hypothetical protein
MMAIKKILIDAKFTELYNGGISSLILNSIKILKLNKKIKFEILTISNLKKYISPLIYFLFSIMSRKIQILLYDNFFFNKVAKKIKPDCILSFYHDLKLSSDFYSKNIIFIHDLSIFDPYKRSFIQYLNDFYYQYTLKRSIKYNPKIITVSNFSALEIQNKLKIPKNSIHIWPQPIPPSFWKNNNFIKKKKNIPVLFYPGGWHPRKGIELLFNTIKEYNKKFGRLEFRYTCYKSLPKNYLKKISILKMINVVVNLNSLSEKKLVSEYKKSNCVIYPSTSEGFGRVVIESILTQTPIVLYNLKVFREIIKKKSKNVYFSKNRDPKKWANLLNKAFQHFQKKNSKDIFKLYNDYRQIQSVNNLLKILTKLI